MPQSRRNFLHTAAVITGTAACSTKNVFSAEEKKTLHPFSDWKEGFLDIHHISTGRGESTFIIAPDGTTMLIDAGDLADGRAEETVLPRLPNGSKLPGEWIAEYIKRFAKPHLDYVMLTHFHSDHIGSVPKTGAKKSAAGYVLTGISEVAEYISIGKIIDRCFPNYDYPTRKQVEGSNKSFFADYLAFADYQRKNRKTVFEKFIPGSKEQFTLKTSPAKYPFTIQNIAANAIVWTGKGTETKTVIPQETVLDENVYSCSVKISYGNFAYFQGGDICGLPVKRDVETAIADVTGKIDVMSMNHHAYSDSANPHFLSILRPRIMVIPVWDTWHPHISALTRMTDKNIYPDERLTFATGMHKDNIERLGDLATSIVSPQGHTVIRVTDGGAKYRVFVLDSSVEVPKVLFATEEISATANGGP
ncbi:MAG: MBL fold metallo-hydrolase [Planctomycetaceae bacterium]|nr:MBL fold metallo-hydrolase [Planctomycetaceae bacterium]